MDQKQWERVEEVYRAAVGFILARTVQYGSVQPQVGPATDLGIPEGAAERLAGSLRIPTISPEDPAAFDAGAFRALHACLQTAFPPAAGSAGSRPAVSRS